MSNNFNIKNCIEEEQLLLYLKGQLSQKEIRQVELHLTDCELCSDALEGLRLLKNKDRADEIVTGLKHNINKKLLKKQRTLPVTQQWWQIAADCCQYRKLQLKYSSLNALLKAILLTSGRYIFSKNRWIKECRQC